MNFGLVKWIKETLFPIFCVSCGKEGEWLCNGCYKKLKIEIIKRCPICNLQTLYGETCARCAHVSFLDGIVALGEYKENEPIAKLIKSLKYGFASEIGSIFKQMANNFVLPDSLKQNKIIIIPIPLHSRRKRSRGFNQSEILAKAIFEVLKDKNYQVVLDLDNLERYRFTTQQTKLAREKRLTNLKDAFVWKGGKINCPVILIDDVFTTGATMQECAKELKKHKAPNVWGLTCGRG